ncbi:UDP-N-acetylmuramate dehydrogenase [Ligilactobacillus sp. Marseille-Q7487]|jgi:UDP-N-acetylmuramate dehydrogenase|uniref:UDP-N-acetylmuramate dehydrogenase n=1 Tax=Ligilactobacillus sp. Marseille-Q7487 TaxID=3022128 RepID=UPI0015B665E1|nr:UDP-N-acetylmuramate dehydrogenase [Ligilactobacillus sp. Marseille-Q7487]
MMIEISQLDKVKLLKDEPLRKYTYTKTGGNADFLAFPKSIAEVSLLVTWAKKNNLPLTVLGNASNLIVKDGGVAGLVIMMTDLKQISFTKNLVNVQAGASLIETTIQVAKHGLTGLEFAAGIPGSIGGAVFMNAGAYGGEIKDVLKEVTVLTPEAKIKTYTAQQLNMSYRHSRLQVEQDIVLEAQFVLSFGDQKAIFAKMDELNYLRASKQPLEYPSCGSVFKRPVGHFTGKLVHDANLQGYRCGDAQVSLKHAGFIVNLNQATAKDYLQVIEHVKQVVWDKFEVKLETEVRIIGRD